MKLRTAVFILAALLCAHTATAQTGQSRHPIRSKIVWTLVGATVGTAIGAYAVWDDDERAAVMQRRMRRSMIVGGTIGGALGFWFGQYRAGASLPRQQGGEHAEVAGNEIGCDHDHAGGGAADPPRADGMGTESQPASEDDLERHRLPDGKTFANRPASNDAGFSLITTGNRLARAIKVQPVGRLLRCP